MTIFSYIINSTCRIIYISIILILECSEGNEMANSNLPETHPYFCDPICCPEKSVAHGPGCEGQFVTYSAAFEFDYFTYSYGCNCRLEMPLCHMWWL